MLASGRRTCSTAGQRPLTRTAHRCRAADRWRHRPLWHRKFCHCTHYFSVKISRAKIRCLAHEAVRIDICLSAFCLNQDLPDSRIVRITASLTDHIILLFNPLILILSIPLCLNQDLQDFSILRITASLAARIILLIPSILILSILPTLPTTSSCKSFNPLNPDSDIHLCLNQDLQDSRILRIPASHPTLQSLNPNADNLISVPNAPNSSLPREAFN